MSKISLKTQWFLRLLDKSQFGRIRLTLPNGEVREFGEGALVASATVKDWKVFDEVFDRGDLGFAECYIDGRVEVERPEAMIEWACLNEDEMRKAIYGAAFRLIFDRIRHLFRANSLAQAKKNIARHYDLGNDFFRLWLDPTMTYSSALFRSENESLEAAQLNKYDQIISTAGITQASHVLEVGCGWGGFLTRAVEKTGCKVTAVTISQEQFQACQKRVQELGMQDKAQVELLDYRKIEGKFDQVVSIEMVEAVGQSYWPAYFAKISSSLKQGGKAVIQGITIREDLFPEYSRGTDFIQKYIFPGGMLLTDSVFRNQKRASGLELEERLSLRESYTKTLASWSASFRESVPEVEKLGFDKKFQRMWELYLAYCQGAFSAGRIDVAQFALRKVN